MKMLTLLPFAAQLLCLQAKAIVTMKAHCRRNEGKEEIRKYQNLRKVILCKPRWQDSSTRLQEYPKVLVEWKN